MHDIINIITFCNDQTLTVAHVQRGNFWIFCLLVDLPLPLRTPRLSPCSFLRKFYLRISLLLLLFASSLLLLHHHCFFFLALALFSQPPSTSPLYAHQESCSSIEDDQEGDEEADSRLDSLVLRWDGSKESKEGRISVRISGDHLPQGRGCSCTTDGISGDVPRFPLPQFISSCPRIPSWAYLCVWCAAASAYAKFFTAHCLLCHSLWSILGHRPPLDSLEVSLSPAS
jgi:hypothetical protein